MTSAPLDIRPLSAEDEREWRELWAAYLAFYKTTRPPEVYAATWARLLGDGPYDPRGFIARREGRAVGIVHFILHRSCWKLEHITYLQDLFVDPAVRGTGAGRALIEAVYAEADRLGAPGVYWLTDENNATARALYDRIAVKSPFIRYNRPV